ncbi:8-oxo-dGTP pyrophosphatase MutT, NUDIX family [Cyclobacterium lianum]|uniref:GDP-mannose pyrophosphatase n=1 Tax=Cyclobacterium lianum TaxID=388280 RepID=A0A1M7PDG0_9BACT|nr:NUDIX hydrolase [Cyclobacterium lianum]SHN14972.1 8-oxo-dGTP pyrophosphatase MutT, NUDIX family [Cyclobacterium lianum]
MKNPWTKLSEKEVYDNPWIRVEEHQVISPRQTKGIYGKVCFKNMAIGIVPLDDERHTWLVGQYRYTLDEYSWEIPMGGGPQGLSALESARRELKEETGLSAKKWTEIMKIHTSNSVTDEVGYVYVAEDLQAGQPEFDDTEDLQIWRLPFSEALEMVMAGRITDAISIAAILKTAAILKDLQP